MRATRLLVLSAAFAAASGSAFADIRTVGSVYVETASKTPVTFTESFPAPIEYLGFIAPHGDVNCQSVWARFSDGSRQEVWRGGRISHGGGTADLGDKALPISSLEFRCSGTPSLFEVQILGDPGKYMSAWRQHPDWNGKWSHRFMPETPTQNIALTGENRS